MSKGCRDIGLLTDVREPATRSCITITHISFTEDNVGAKTRALPPPSPFSRSLDQHHHPMHRRGMLGVATTDAVTAAISVAVQG
jgi:hypothetical protein